MNIIPYIKSGYSVLYIVSPEEGRIDKSIVTAAVEVKRSVQFWSATEGFMDADGKPQSSTEDPMDALREMKKGAPGTIFVAHDLHSYFTNARCVRLVRDIARDFKQSKKTLIMVSSTRKVPAELERDLTVLDFSLPSRNEIRSVWETLYSNDGVKKRVGELSADEHDLIVQAAMGLTTLEAENAFAKAIIEFIAQPAPTAKAPDTRTPISKLVLTEKALAVKKNGILEYFEAKQTANDIGGLENLKLWLTMRKNAFTKKARDFGLPLPRGILLVGLPGCGKSLSAKAASNILGVPLIRFDVGKVFGGVVGESESNMRSVIQTVEAVGNCVLWIDEMEKAFAGMGSSNSGDSGTSQRVFGNFITWLQEKTVPCFVIATVNRIDGLPPELLRKGRFDEIFFVGLPNEEERAAIFPIHLQRLGRKPDLLKKAELQACVKASDKFSGAEIEEGIISALYSAFHHERELNADDILKSLSTINPLSISRKADLDAMATWAASNAINASRIISTKDKITVTKGATTVGGRQLDIS